MEDLTNLIKKHQKEIDALMRRKMPVSAGRMAKDHFQDNFRKGGFVNNGLRPWPPSGRLSSGGVAASSRYGTLLSSRNHLFSSIAYVPVPYSVVVRNDVPYAHIHNEGGVVEPTVTPAMRKYAWYRFFRETGGKNPGRKAPPPQASRWKALALTKKSKLRIRIPRRRFIGESAELSAKITKKLETEILRILNK